MNKAQFSAIFGGAFDRTISFNPAFARIGGSAAAGLFLSQLFYWSDRGRLADGWIHKSQTEWQAETFLTPSEQKTARAALLATGVLEESPMRKLALIYDMDPTARFSKELCYRINFEVLEKCLCSQNGPQTRVVIVTQEIADRCSENRQPVQNKPLTGAQKSADLYTESSPESSSETTTTGKSKNGGGENIDLDELMKAAAWAAEKAGTKIRSRENWEFKLRDKFSKAVKKGAIDPADLATLAAYRKSLARSVEHSQRTTAASALPKIDPAILAAAKTKGDLFLAKTKAHSKARIQP